jgi:DNA polymerase III subunit delta
MLIFIFGQDTYRSREEMRKIIADHKKASLNWFNFMRIDAKEKEAEIFEQIRETVNTGSMFSEKKLIIAENVFSAPIETQSKILEFLKNKNMQKDGNAKIVFWAEEIETKNELLEYLEKNAECRKFELLRGAQLKNWVKKYITENKGIIENQAIDKLIERVGGDLWRMYNEINKLLSHNQKIGVADIELLIKPEIDLNVFEIIDAIGTKNKNKALKLMGDYFEKGEDEIRLLGMFVYQFRNLIKVKSAPTENLGLHPFVLRKTGEQARNFSFEELKKIYYQLLTIDFNIKLGKVNAVTALELFVGGL